MTILTRLQMLHLKYSAKLTDNARDVSFFYITNRLETKRRTAINFNIYFKAVYFKFVLEFN